MLDALVVGAGPTGLTLALELARRRLKVRVVDKATSPPLDRSRAVVVQARTLEIFEQLGIAEEALQRGHVNPALNLVLSNGHRARLPLTAFDGLSTPFPMMLMLPQEHDEELLAAKLAEHGVPVERGVELISFEQDAERVRCSVAGGRMETVEARWLCGCDGAHSAVRRGAGISFDGDTYDDHCLLGQLELDWQLPDGEAFIVPRRRGILAAFPVPGARRFRIICILPEAHPAGPDALSLDEFSSVMRELLPVPFRVTQAFVLSRYRLHHRMATRFRAGRVFLLGDAAHIHSPAGGQGMNTGIQDAWNLGWKIAAVAQGRMEPALLDSYELERMPTARQLLQFTDRLFAAMAAHGAFAKTLRAVAPSLIGRAFALKRVQREIVGFGSQLRIRYPSSPLSTQLGARPHGAPAPGDRAPDGELMIDGTTSRLFTQLGTTHVLLLFGATPAQRAALEPLSAADFVVFDAGLHTPLAERYGAERTAGVLIRPDGHIAVRTDPLDVDALTREVSRRFIEARAR